MKKKTRSILTELQNFLPEGNKDAIIENRASHIIQSAINLLEQIKNSYPAEQAEDLEKRFYSSLRNRDPKRFERKIKEIKEGNGDKNVKEK
jgi:hypothetical protein